MNKQAKKCIIIVLSCIAVAVSYFAFAYNYYRTENAYLETLFFYDSNYRFPDEIRNYPEDRRGHFQFDAQTVIMSLEQGKIEALVPLFPNDTGDPFTPSGASWAPTEFLQVASVLSELVWGEPLDLDTWYVRDMFFRGGDCNRNLGRFSRFKIIYYHQKIESGASSYTARYISLSPSIGLAEWGGDGKFESLALFAWKKIEFSNFKITADDAVQIAEENGGKVMRENMKNDCAISVSIRENPRRFYAYDWYVEYYHRDKPFSIFVNPFTGGDVY